MIAPANTRTKPYTLNASEPAITAITKPTGAEQNARIAPFRAKRYGFFAVTITDDEDREQRSSKFKALSFMSLKLNIFYLISVFVALTTTSRNRPTLLKKGYRTVTASPAFKWSGTDRLFLKTLGSDQAPGVATV